tara:strand:- start:81114 stop:82871 length:1758 start_codon:yes stop_codon:yes gene_type:complete
MDYLLKASGLVLILFLFYYIFLKHETFFKSIRGYFLISLLLVLSMPLIEIPVYVERVVNQLNALNYTTISPPELQIQESFNWVELLTFSYLLGVLIFSIKFLLQLISLSILLSKHKFIKQGKQYFVETSKSVSPFSFFNIIVYNKSQFTIAELEQIINHEKAHVLQWHSVDTILAHLLVITLWFNPFVWLFKKAIQENLEYLADEHVIKLAQNQKLYQLTLLKTCSTNYCTEITNNFYNSLIKKRIIMLHKNRSQKMSQWKYTLLAPLLIAFVFAFNTTIIAQEKSNWEINIGVIDLIIDKSSTLNELNKHSNEFKKEHDIALSFKGIKRNENNEITAIKINAKGTNLKAKFENSGNKAIKPIIITYDSENNSLNISNIEKMGIHEIQKFANTYYSKNNDDKENHYSVTATYFDDDSEINIDSIKNLEVQEFIINGEKENVWSEKKKKGSGENSTIEIIREGDSKVKIIRKVHEDSYKTDETGKIKIEVIEDNDNASEHNNVYIIKTDSDKMNNTKISKKENFVFVNSKDDEPLYILNGKEISKKEMVKKNPEDIESINVLKGESAKDKYGDKGKNGVILITTKK